jgi:hypothetical protein
MSSLGNRVSRLEARTRRGTSPVVVKVFDPREIDDVKEGIAEAEQDAVASGHQLLAIRIVDPWRNGENECTARWLLLRRLLAATR